jgi:hypothetical protein
MELAVKRRRGDLRGGEREKGRERETEITVQNKSIKLTRLKQFSKQNTGKKIYETKHMHCVCL